MLLKIHAVSHKGLVRVNNEDHFLVADQIFTNKEYSTSTETDQGFFLAVADGMGGHNAGEVASLKVLEDLLVLGSKFSPSLNFENFCKVMNNWVDMIHAQLINLGNQSFHLKGMGTTLTGVYFLQNRAYLFNIGDSRTYIASNGLLKQLTTDHSKTQYYGSGNRMANFLTNCLGAGTIAFVDLADISHLVQPGNTLLTCSDGLTDMLSDEKISALVKTDQPQLLLDEALKAGGRDNITYIETQFL